MADELDDDEIEATLLELLKNGSAEMSVDEKGERLWRLTPKGMAEAAALVVKEMLVPRAGTFAHAIRHDGSPIGVVRVDESDPVGDVVGPWWSGTVVSTGERLLRLRPCHYAGAAEAETSRDS